MSTSNLFVNSTSSFVGTISGVFIAPYLKKFLTKNRRYALRVEQYLSELEHAKDYIINDEIIACDPDDVSLNDSIKYKETNDKVKNIIQIIYKNRYNISHSITGKYGEKLEYFIEKIFDRYFSHKKEICDGFNSSYFSHIPIHEIYTYRKFIIDEGNFASDALREINTIKSSIWHRKLVKKVMSYFF